MYFMFKVSSFAYTVVCVYVPLSTLCLTEQRHHATTPPKGRKTPWTLTFYIVRPLRSELDNFKDNMNSSKPVLSNIWIQGLLEWELCPRNPVRLVPLAYCFKPFSRPLHKRQG